MNRRATRRAAAIIRSGHPSTFTTPKGHAMSKQNIAIIGLGFGSEFIPIYQRHPNANMYAICQRTKSKLDQIGKYFKVEKRYTEYDDLLKDKNVDVVHINTPIPDHGWQSIKALKAGKHVA